MTPSIIVNDKHELTECDQIERGLILTPYTAMKCRLFDHLLNNDLHKNLKTNFFFLKEEEVVHFFSPLIMPDTWTFFPAPYFVHGPKIINCHTLAITIKL